MRVLAPAAGGPAAARRRRSPMASPAAVAAQRVIGVAMLAVVLGVASPSCSASTATGRRRPFMGGWQAPVRHHPGGRPAVARCCWWRRWPPCWPCSSSPSASPGRRHASGLLPPRVPGARRRRRASFLTGDLFNLFVAFEMMLTASYVLITLGGRRDQVRTGMTYVVINLIALDAVRDRRRPALRRHRHGEHGRPGRADGRRCPTGVRAAFALLLFVVFGIKAAVFPLFFWLPDSYPTAPDGGHRRVRRPAHQGRRVLHHPHPDAARSPSDRPVGAPARDRRRSRWSSACSAPSPRTT